MTEDAWPQAKQSSYSIQALFRVYLVQNVFRSKIQFASLHELFGTTLHIDATKQFPGSAWTERSTSAHKGDWELMQAAQGAVEPRFLEIREIQEIRESHQDISTSPGWTKQLPAAPSNPHHSGILLALNIAPLLD